MWPRLVRQWLGMQDPQRGRRRRRRHAMPLVPRLEWLEDRTAPALFTWTNGDGNGSWNDAANWSSNPSEPGLTPGSGDDVSIVSANGAAAITLTGQSAAVASVTSAVPIDVVGPGTTLQISGGGNVPGGGLSLSSHAALTITQGGGLGFTAIAQALQSTDGTGAVVFGDGNPMNLIMASGVQVTVNAGFAIHGGAGRLSGFGSFVNNGTITAESGGDITLSTKVSGSGTLTTDTGNSSQITQDGAVIDGNTIAGTMVFTNNPVNELSNVTIAKSGDVSGSAGQEQVAGTLTLHGKLHINGGAAVAFGVNPSEKDTIAGDGSVVFDGNTSNLLSLNNNVQLTVASGVKITGQNGTIGPVLFPRTGTLINQGTIAASAAAAGTITVTANTTNTGTLEALGGSTLAIVNCTISGNGMLATDSNAASNVLQNGSAIDTNTITGTLVYGSGTTGNILSGVTIAKGAVVTGTSSIENVNGNLTLNGTLQINGGSSLDFAAGTSTVSGTGSITFDNASNALTLNAAATLTFGAGITISGQSATIGTAGVGALVNDGTMAPASGGRFTIDPASFTNNGTISVAAAATANVTGTFANLTNIVGGIGTLQGGIYTVAGLFEFAGANIGTNAATITLNGLASAIVNTTTGGDALAALASNAAGSNLTLTAGRTLTTAGSLSNAGALTIDATAGSGSVTVTGAYTQTGGITTLVAGAALASTTATVNIQAGTLAGTGTVNANLTVAGMLSPGTAAAAGVVTVSGNLTLQSGATLTEKLTGPHTSNPVAGTDYDQVSVSGTVMLNNPTLSGSRFTNYVPVLGTTFTIINNTGAAAVSGNFSGQVQGSMINVGGLIQQITYAGGDGNDVQLTTPAPTTVYVDAAWAGTAAGTDPATDPIGGLVFGYNAFAVIPSAIGEVAGGGTVVVYGGTYNAALDVTKPLSAIQTAVNLQDAFPAAQVTLGGAVTLGVDTTFAMASAGLDFASTVNDDTAGTDTLTITGGPLVIFAGPVGGSKPLKAVSDQASRTDLNTASITTTGAQSYAGSATLGAAITLASTSAGAIALGNVDGGFALTVNTAGITTFAGAVGSQTPLAAVTTDAAGSTDIDANITTTGGQTYQDAIALGGSVTLTAQSGTVALDGGTLSLGSNTLTVNNSDAASAITGAITGTGGLTKTGSGTLTVTATESYAGTTNVNAGTLLVNGSVGSTAATTVKSTATLGGTGSLAGSVFVNSGGTVSPGSSTAVGKLTIAGGYTQLAGGTLVLKLAGNTTPGTSYDALAIGGTASLNGTIQTTALGGFRPASGDTYHVLTFASSTGDFATRSGFVFGGVFLVEQSGATSLDLLALTSPIVVTNPTDSPVAGKTSLRDAVAYADAGSLLGVAVTIDFAAGLAGQTILLTHGPLEIGPSGPGSGTITIDGSSLAQPVTISGNYVASIVQIDSGMQTNLTGLDFTAGASITGGAILNDGTLTVTGSTFTGNTASSGGGAIASIGTLTVTGSTFTGNTVTGTTSDGGGAIAVEHGSATITGNNFAGNQVTAASPAAGADSAGGAIVAFSSSTIQFNRFSGNSDAAAGHGNAVAVVGSAKAVPDDDWWAFNTGPAAGAVVSGTAGTFAPLAVNDFLLLNIAASPNPILNTQSTTVTAGFTTDSAGHAIAAGNLGVLVGQAITFAGNTAPGSALTGTQATIQANGQATVTYNAGPHGGLDTVTATVDGVTAPVTIVIDEPPTITSAAATTFTVGTSSTFTITTFGFPAPTIARTGTLPGGVQFQDAGNGSATLSGTPSAGTGNVYTLSFTAHNGIGSDNAQTFTLTVDEAPTITSAPAATLTVGSAGSFTITTGHDFPAATALTYSGTLPSGVQFHDNGDGTATLAGNPATGTGNTYPLTITAHNGISPDFAQSFTLTIDEAPSITSPGSATFAVGVNTPFTVTALGFPLPRFTTAGIVPAGITLGQSTGVLTGSAGPSTGVYVFSVSAANPLGTATQSFTLTVNAPPTITAPAQGTFTVGQLKATTLSITARPGIPPTVTLTESGALPAGLAFAARAGNATIAGIPSANTGGSYPVIITAKSGPFPAIAAITLTVNQSPAITSTNSATLASGPGSSFLVTATGFPAPTFSLSPSIPGISLTSNANGTATLTAPGAAAKPYTLTITAGNGQPAIAKSTQTFTLTVVQPPSLTITGNPTLTQLQAPTLTVTAGPGAPLIRETGRLPTGVTFRSGNGTASLGGKPAPGTGGTYSIALSAGTGVASTSRTITLTVPQSPAITSTNSATLAAGPGSSFVVTATGYPAPTFSLSPSIPGITLTSNANGTATLTAPSAAAKPYTLTITAGNGQPAIAKSTQTFTLTVVQPPSLTITGNPTLTQLQAPTLTVTAGPGAPLIRETGRLPTGLTFRSGNGTASFGGKPAPGTGGPYPITLTAGTGVATTRQTLTVVVDQPASIISVAATTFTLGEGGSFLVKTGGFPLPTTFSLSGAVIPAGVSLVSNNDGTATLTPPSAAFATPGTYTLTITAGNGIGTGAPQTFHLTIDRAPIFLSAPGFTFTIGSAAAFTVATAAFPFAKLTETGVLPRGLTFTANANGTATLHGKAATGTRGSYTLVLTASNGALPAALQLFTLSVVA